MIVYIPCLNVDKPDSGGGFSVSVTVYSGPGDPGGLAPGIVITHSDSPISMRIGPIPPFIYFGPNWAFWSQLFGLGETRIERQKEQIQQIMTPIFQYLKYSYGVPVRDNHALQFSSDGVKEQFRRRPDIAALVPYLDVHNDTVANLIFAVNDTNKGQEERVSNQFLANAAINNWPVNATLDIWDGLVSASSPDCSSDPNRWMYNPEIIQRASELAVLLQYIPLSTLSLMATVHAIGSPIAESLIQQWAMNPALVADIPHIDKYDWQQYYLNGQWGLPRYADGDGNLVPLLNRDETHYVTYGLTFPKPYYPDFIWPQGQNQPIPTPPQPPGGGGGQGPGDGGGQQPGDPPPPPQPPTPPDTQNYPPPPPPQERTRPPQDHDGFPDQWDIEFACEYWRLLDQGFNIPQSYIDWTQTYIGQAATSVLRNDPYCRQFKPQPQPPPPGPQPQKTPTQQDLDLACKIVIKLLKRQALTQAEYDWMLTEVGAKALAIAINDPKCTPEYDPNDPHLPQPQPNECPPPQYPPQYPQPGPFPPPQPYPYPYPQPPPPPGDQPCPPECTQLIELLRQRQEECCELTTLVVIPRIDWIIQWLIDIENRLPGPIPPLPPLPPSPPGIPQPPPIPPDLDDPPPLPPGGLPPPLPPEIVACIETLCNQENFCNMVQDCERELECFSEQACNLGVRIAGVLAECWLQTHTPRPDDVMGIFAGVNGPQRMLASLIECSPETIRSKGIRYPGPRPFDWQGEWAGATGDFALACEHAGAVAMAWTEDGALDAGLPPEIQVPVPPYVFASPEEREQAAFKVRSLKLRPDEIDPCLEAVL